MEMKGPNCQFPQSIILKKRKKVYFCGTILAISVQNLEIFQSKKQTYRKTQFSMLTRVISLSKTIKKLLSGCFYYRSAT